MTPITVDPTQFLFAGKAVVTLKSKKSGAHYTYRISKAADKDDLLFLSVLTGPDNTADYQYAFMIRLGHDDFTFRPTKGSKVAWDAPSVVAARWMLANMSTPKFREQAELYHEGRCCRCGRTLTTPESIAAGIGPECASKLN